MIYATFENIPVPEDNGKQNPGESYTNKYKKHVAYSYGYKLVCLAVKSYLGEMLFIKSMIEESKCCTDLMKKPF